MAKKKTKKKVRKIVKKRRIIKRVIRLISYLILLFLIISLILLNSNFFKEKIYSAHLSYVDSCIPESLTAIQNIGVSLAGQTIQTINKTTGEIIVVARKPTEVSGVFGVYEEGFSGYASSLYVLTSIKN